MTTVSVQGRSWPGGGSRGPDPPVADYDHSCKSCKSVSGSSLNYRDTDIQYLGPSGVQPYAAGATANAHALGLYCRTLAERSKWQNFTFGLNAIFRICRQYTITRAIHLHRKRNNIYKSEVSKRSKWQSVLDLLWQREARYVTTANRSKCEWLHRTYSGKRKQLY